MKYHLIIKKLYLYISRPAEDVISSALNIHPQDEDKIPHWCDNWNLSVEKYLNDRQKIYHIRYLDLIQNTE